MIIFLGGHSPRGQGIPGHIPSPRVGSSYPLPWSCATAMFCLCGWPELVPDGGMQTGNFFSGAIFLVPVGMGWGGAGRGSLVLGVCQGAKALRPDGKHAQCQPQNGPELPPSLCDCFLLQHYHQSLVNSHIRALCFHACPRSWGRQRRSFPSLGQVRTESEHKGRRDHGSTSWTKASLLRQQDRQGLPRVSDRQLGSLWTTLRSPS